MTSFTTNNNMMPSDYSAVQLYMLHKMPFWGYMVMATILSAGGLIGSTLFVNNVLSQGVAMLDGRREPKTSWRKEFIAGINIVILFFFGLAVLYSLPRLSNVNWAVPALNAATLWGIVLAPMVSLLMNDLFYWVYHGAVHKNRTLYRWIHYMHHEIRTPTGGALDTYYEHPLDFIFGTTCALAPLVLTPGIHIFGVFVHLLSNTVIAIADHSGRDIKAGWGIFAAVDHDVHHQFGYGNFAQNFSVIDHLFGTHITPLQRAADVVTSSPTKSDDLAAVEAVAAAVAASLLANKKPEAVTADNASAAVPASGMADSDLDALGVAG